MAALVRFVNGEPVDVRRVSAHELARLTDDGAAVRVRRIELTVEQVIETLTRVEREKEPALTLVAALDRVFSKEPALYAAHRADTTLNRGGATFASVRVTIEKKKAVSSGGSTQPSALAIIEAKVKEIMASTNLTEREALDQALEESPSLYAQYTEELQRRVNGLPSVSTED